MFVDYLFIKCIFERLHTVKHPVAIRPGMPPGESLLPITGFVLEGYLETRYSVVLVMSEREDVGYNVYVAPGGDMAVHIYVRHLEHILILPVSLFERQKPATLPATEFPPDCGIGNLGYPRQVGRPTAVHVYRHPRGMRPAYGLIRHGILKLEQAVGIQTVKTVYPCQKAVLMINAWHP